jgi:peroxiredoxin
LALALVFASVSVPVSGCSHIDPELAAIQTSGYVLPTVDGQPYALANQRGRVVLLTFFATWCEPCLAETGLLTSLAKKRAQDLTVVGIGLDIDGARTLKLYREQLQLPYPILVADEATREGRSPFGRIELLPTTFVLDREGRVRHAFSGVPDEHQLERLIDQMIAG